MFCRNCGKEIDESFNVCPFCAQPVKVTQASQEPHAEPRSATQPQPAQQQPKSSDDENTGGIKVLGFFLGLFGPCAWFLPVVSLVLYLVWRNDKPKTAAAIGKFTVIGLIVGLALFILASIITAVIFTFFAAGSLIDFAGSFIGKLFELFPFSLFKNLFSRLFSLFPFNMFR